MAKPKPRSNKKKRVRRLANKDNCHLCKSGEQPNYQAFEKLAKYTSDRGRILNRSITRVCAKHQRLIALEIKRARHLALLKFVAEV